MAIESFTGTGLWQIYYYVAIFATIVFAIKLIIFSFTGGDVDINTDIQADVHVDSFSFLSIQSVLAFLMGFGWMGYAAIKQFDLSQLFTFLSAVLVGLLFMCVNTFLMFLVRKLEKNVKRDPNTSLGKIGKAYTVLQPKSIGQIEVEMSGQLSVVEAMNDSDEIINSFETIKVVKVIDGILYVVKIK